MGTDDGRSKTDLRELTVDDPGRIDAVLAAAYPDLSRARVQRLIASGHARRNGEVVRKSLQVFAGDHLEILLEPAEHIAPASIPTLEVLYEDDALVAISKPAGVVTHGGPGDTAPSVAGWFLARYSEAASAFDAERPGIVHRLDKDTSGVLLLAKTPVAQASLSAAFEERTTDKRYLAVVDGVPTQERAAIDAGIARHPGDRTRMAIANRGRESRTEYEVLAADKDNAFLLVHPLTGRTHQIRVHLAAVGHPVSGDAVYGHRGAHRRHLLHAWRLTVPHPAGGTLTITSPLPTDIAAAIRSFVPQAIASVYTLAAPANRES